MASQNMIHPNSPRRTTENEFKACHLPTESNNTNIHICMIDTWHTPSSEFYHAATLVRLFKVPDSGKLQHRFFTAEYLTIGDLHLNEGNSYTIPFSAIIAPKVKQSIPELAKEGGKLWLPVAHMRECNFLHAVPISKGEIELAMKVVADVCVSLKRALFVNLLLFRKGKMVDGELRAVLEKDFFRTYLEGGFTKKKCEEKGSEDAILAGFAKLSYESRDRYTLEVVVTASNNVSSTIQPQENLFLALESLYDHHASVTDFEWFWVDVICIYQNSIVDREFQVQQMREVYREVSEVMGWLGPSRHSCGRDVFTILEQLGSNSEAYVERFGPSGLDDLFKTEERFEALTSLCKRAYWQRM
ncbi:hypothetical protein G7Y89_g7874 [Cudoniella acicularis]|uniref:Heterokaryon incompatibility domain-containing protein n=1 Tax=Cudoniella acicularis TaxID=354080 RepID=A0A8H4RHK5_9HELO|nr:hypothetical protein G7Y89_g7874 [Cudoniella acicularis]